MEDILNQNLSEENKAKHIIAQAISEGFRWQDALGAIAKVREELDELEEAFQQGNDTEIKSEFGDVLWTLQVLAQYINCSQEEAISTTNKRFVYRYTYMKEYLEKQGLTFENSPKEEWFKGWRLAKQQEKELKTNA